MNKKEISIPIPKETIINQIIFIRGQKVILDYHLAAFYKVETRALKQAVKRNMDLFPSDFMFVLTDAEVVFMVSQNVIASKKQLGGSLPYAFTEVGVAMLSGVLKSKRAKETNIAIMRAFVALRRALIDNTELSLPLKKKEKKVIITPRTLR